MTTNVSKLKEIITIDYLNTFYSIDYNVLMFDGHKTSASNEVNSIRRHFCLGDKAESILRDWCIINGMSETGWMMSMIPRMVYSPYIPMVSTPEVNLDINIHRSSRLSRYQVALVNTDYYGLIHIGNA
jgi:hypothetical protein